MSCENLESTPPGDQDEAIDRARDEFESAWRSGSKPDLKGYLLRFTERVQPKAFDDLIRVEIEFRRKLRIALNADDYLKRFPQFSMNIEKAFGARHKMDPGDEVLTQQFSTNQESSAMRLASDDQAKSVGEQQTIDHTPTRKESRGLHIRCPHCSNPVELLADTPFEDISCNSCGSMFSLIDREESTRMSTPLRTIDRFDLISRLGVGGFGTVWKARDRELDRVVAVKIPRRGQLLPTEIEQFFREARSAAQLRHPNIVPVHEVGREGETLFIVSDFIRGVALSDWLTANRATAREIVERCLPIADALHHAHEHGVIHRDLKPSNIMIDEAGQPYLMDFGLAKREIGEVTMTVDGQILGTPRYMSPEQAGGQGHWTDRRTDIYSLGIMLFEMLTGETPFRGNAQMQIHQRLSEDAPDPRKLNRHIPRDLATICLKCLEREPGRRYATAGELSDEFRRYLRGEPTHARPLSRPARLFRWVKRKPMVATLGALTIFLAIGGPATALLIERQRSRLSELLSEKNHLIDRYATDQRDSASQIVKLKNNMSVWEGKANPWDLWPPKPVEPPRRQVLQKLFEHTQSTLIDSLRKGEYGTDQSARGYLALGYLADQLAQSEARSYFASARRLLVQLHDQYPQDNRFPMAIGDCELQLAKLASENNRNEAKENLQRARANYEHLAHADQTNPMHKVKWLEAELYSATVNGFELAAENLRRATAINAMLQESWPAEPDKIYELACFLTNQPATLALSTTAKAD